MQHAEKRINVWYATLTVPADVRHIIGKVRFFQSTNTDSARVALPRVALLVSQWKEQIAAARGTMPDPKATYWETLRADFLKAKDEANSFAAQDQIEKAVKAITEPEKASRAWKYATEGRQLRWSPWWGSGRGP
jgi:hypothetical protein